MSVNNDKPGDGNLLVILPCLDSAEMADDRQAELDIPRDRAADLGRSAVEAVRQGLYLCRGDRVDWAGMVRAACESKRSIPPDALLPDPPPGAGTHPVTKIQVANETTLAAARRMVASGARPLALNFANGIHPGGGFLHGARAQEEFLCRSSALYATLEGDPMYAAHRLRPKPDSTDWAILSPLVPVFRDDNGSEIGAPWTLDVLTCAAPYAPTVGRDLARDLLRSRIHRVLAIARARGYASLVLGAWGCGAFGNDAHAAATDFREALEGSFAGAFDEIVFAITDWSRERWYLGPFRDVFR